MTTTSYPFDEAARTMRALRKLDQRESERIEAIRADYRRRREELLAAAPKAVQTLVVQAIAEEQRDAS